MAALSKQIGAPDPTVYSPTHWDAKGEDRDYGSGNAGRATPRRCLARLTEVRDVASVYVRVDPPHASRKVREGVRIRDAIDASAGVRVLASGQRSGGTRCGLTRLGDQRAESICFRRSWNTVRGRDVRERPISISLWDC